MTDAMLAARDSSAAIARQLRPELRVSRNCDRSEGSQLAGGAYD
jgi:hypothetical protein